MARPTQAEAVLRACRELGPAASLHEIAYLAQLSHRQVAAIMRQIGGKRVSEHKTNSNDADGKLASRWTIAEA